MHTFDATVDTKAMPFAYLDSKDAPGKDPDPHKLCDSPLCDVTDQAAQAFRLPCYLSYHPQVLFPKFTTILSNLHR